MSPPLDKVFLSQLGYVVAARSAVKVLGEALGNILPINPCRVAWLPTAWRAQPARNCRLHG